jgi:hypothetical protein
MEGVSDYVPQSRPTDYGTFWVTTEIMEHDGRWSGVYRVSTLVGKDEAEVSRWFYTEDEAEKHILALRALDDALWAKDEAARARAARQS